MKFHITNDFPKEAGTTVGYWRFEKSRNSGTLHIYCKPLPDRRFQWAVIGHELIEAFWCWLGGITTETCDDWDIVFEKRYESGEFPYEFEAGDHPDCPYHRGHRLGVMWEYMCIYGTFAGFSRYGRACDLAMDIVR